MQTGGGGPCHLAIDKQGKTLFVANYGSGSVAAFRLQPDGAIGQRIAFQQHHGSSVNPKRQRGPHAHAVVLSPDGRFLFVPDLGLDQIISYRVSGDGGLAPTGRSTTVRAGLWAAALRISPERKVCICLMRDGLPRNRIRL